ncbi:MAG: CDP-alcohol phosphatidyltransferase family protein [Steroidobacteraceae bacterium]|jgi:phosphatidylglycerophosphate synthase
MKPLHRINDSVLGTWERPTLAWLAGRLPHAVVPDHLTAFGVFGAMLTATGYVLSRESLAWLWLANAGLLINWFGDSLDGTLARLRRIERPRYGFFIDHTSDLFCQTITFISLGVSPLAHFAVACLGLITFLIAFVYTLITAQARGTMRITYFYFGPTEIRALLFLGNLLTLAVGVIDLRPWLSILPGSGAVSIHDIGIALLALSGLIVIALLAISDARALAREDPPPT